MHTVCESHRLSFLTLYESRQTLCCNPLPNRHLSGSVNGTKPISYSMYKKAKGTLPLVPGKKLCRCAEEVFNLVGENEEEESSQSLENSQEVPLVGQVHPIGHIPGILQRFLLKIVMYHCYCSLLFHIIG